MSRWLLQSLLLSVALTVVLNVAGRLLGGRPRRDRPAGPTRPEGPAATAPGHPPTARRAPSTARIVVPWKMMLALSLIGTVILNLVIRLR